MAPAPLVICASRMHTACLLNFVNSSPLQRHRFKGVWKLGFSLAGSVVWEGTLESWIDTSILYLPSYTISPLVFTGNLKVTGEVIVSFST